jgi:hypothetical protein
MDDFVAHHTSDTTELLKVLRQNIRRELGLEKTSIEFRYLRVHEGKESRMSNIEVVVAANEKPTAPQARPVPSPLVGEG